MSTTQIHRPTAWGAEVLGTGWLVLAGCGTAVLAGDQVGFAGVAAAERPFVAEARVGWATLGRTGECVRIPEAPIVIVRLHAAGSLAFPILPVMRPIDRKV